MYVVPCRSLILALALGSCFGGAAGCQTGMGDGTLQREARLTADGPFNRRFALWLEGVEPDGTVRFRQGTNLYELKPGDMPTPPLGPQVACCDPKSQTAVVLVWDSESFKTYAMGPLEFYVPDTVPTPVDILWSPLLAAAWLLVALLSAGDGLPFCRHSY